MWHLYRNVFLNNLFNQSTLCILNCILQHIHAASVIWSYNIVHGNIVSTEAAQFPADDYSKTWVTLEREVLSYLLCLNISSHFYLLFKLTLLQNVDIWLHKRSAVTTSLKSSELPIFCSCFLLIFQLHFTTSFSFQCCSSM